MKPMRAAFRVDSSACIGSGHAMRCIALANDLGTRGVSSMFVCRNFDGNLASRILSEGHEVSILSCDRQPRAVSAMATFADYKSWLGDDSDADASATIDSLTEFSPDCIIVDHYAIDYYWERRLREALSAKIIVIDGLANRKHDCDALVDPTYSTVGPKRWDGLVPEACELLAGLNFALLRPEFYAAKHNLPPRDGKVKTIFVTFGGMDSVNATESIVDMLINLNFNEIIIEVVISNNNRRAALIESKYNQRDNVRLHIQPENIAEIMLRSDIAISSGGGVLIEQCFLGLPSIAVSVADNQTAALVSLADAGLIEFGGSLLRSGSLETIGKVRSKLLRLLKAPSRLLDMQSACKKALPGTANLVAPLIFNLVKQ